MLLVLGLRPERLLDAEGRIDAFVDPPGPEHVGVLVEAVTSGLQAAGSVLAIARPTRSTSGSPRSIGSMIDSVGSGDKKSPGS